MIAGERAVTVHTANTRIADTRRRLGLVMRRHGLRGIGQWSELAAWRAGLADQIERRQSQGKAA